uniref:G-protein coupled receptors family 1 profile domain-containing protein n=1 Tax=Sparus aurata TaxID=8175 RepID=A0A671WM73_SPAAU
MAVNKAIIGTDVQQIYRCLPVVYSHLLTFTNVVLQVRVNHVAPTYVINLLVSNLLQFCGRIIRLSGRDDKKIEDVGSFLYSLGLLASVGFMVCVAMERYLVITCPLWYRCRRPMKISVMVCAGLWVAALISRLFWFYSNYQKVPITIAGTYILLPIPLLIFFLGGTLKALSASRVPSDEKRRIIGSLVLVLLIHTLLFLPTAILFLAGKNLNNHTFYQMSILFLRLSPFADLLLYVFMRKGIIDKHLAAVCCCRMNSNDSSRMNSNDVCSSSA